MSQDPAESIDRRAARGFLNADHVVAGTTSSGVVTALAVLFGYFQNVPARVASAEAFLTLLVLGVLGGAVQAIWRVSIGRTSSPKNRVATDQASQRTEIGA